MIDLFSVLDLSRFQFAQTTIFHFFFVPFSIGMALLVAIIETIYVVTGKEMYKTMAKFWGKIFLLSFAVGIVTGIIQEFQFGMNWSEYSRYVGDIFGAPLAVEALVAFFAESTFIGLWSFTWDKFKPVVHVLFIWIVAIGSSISALWILAANAFMQNPVGYVINNNMHRAELTSFLDLLTNKQVWLEFPHVIFGAFATASFAIIGMSAFKLLNKKLPNGEVKIFRSSMQIAAIVGMVSVLLGTFTGDRQTLELQTQQPMKYSAMEGIDHTIDAKNESTNSMPWSLVSITDQKTHEVKYKIEVPYVLSILGNHSLTGGRTEGTQEINKDLKDKFKDRDIKDFYLPENTLFYSFRIMAMGAGYLLLIAALTLFFNRKKSNQIIRYRWFLWILGITTFVPFIINTAGWLVTELGRYPWVVYGLLTIKDAVSPNATVASLMFTNIVYFATFATLGLVMIFLSKRILDQGPYYEIEDNSQELNNSSILEGVE